MAKKELKLEKLKIELNVSAKNIKILDSTIPNKIEIDISEELKGYIHKALNLVESHLID